MLEWMNDLCVCLTQRTADKQTSDDFSYLAGSNGSYVTSSYELCELIKENITKKTRSTC